MKTKEELERQDRADRVKWIEAMKEKYRRDGFTHMSVRKGGLYRVMALDCPEVKGTVKVVGITGDGEIRVRIVAPEDEVPPHGADWTFDDLDELDKILEGEE